MSSRAVFYVRLSRDTAASTSIQGQNDDLYELAHREGWQIVATFEDNGRSGGKQRANAQEALAMIRDGRADVLAVYAYDRWSRMGIADSADVINTIYGRAESKRPARFIAMREGIDSDREGWELLTAFTADIAQKERQRMVQRRTASIARMRAAGRNPGNGPAPYGYRSAPFDDGRPGKRLVIDPGEAAVIRSLATKLLAGQSTTKLARRMTADRIPMPRSPYRLAAMAGKPTTDPETGDSLPTGTWSSARLSELIRSDHLLGRMRVNTSRAKGGKSDGELLLDPETGLPATPFEPILDVETFEAVKRRFSTRGPMSRRAAQLLSGLVYCGYCDSPMYVVSDGTYLRYRCSGPSRGLDCKGVRVSVPKLDALVLTDYRSTFGRMQAFDVKEHHGSPDVAREIVLLAERIAAIGVQIATETDETRATALFTDMQRLKARRADLDALPVAVTRERVYTGQSVGERLDAAPDIETRRAYLREAYDHVVVFRSDDHEHPPIITRSTLEYEPDPAV